MALQKREKVMVIICVIAGIGALFQYFVFPKFTEFGEMKQTIITKQNELQKAKFAKRRLADLEKRVAEIKNKVAETEKLLPTKAQLPELLVMLNTIVKTSGIDSLFNINPQPAKTLKDSKILKGIKDCCP